MSALAAQPLACRDPRVTVTSTDPALAQTACATADRALTDLAACNVVLEGPVEIALVDTLPDRCVGLYHCDTGLIEVLSPASYPEARRTDGLYAPLSDEVFFAGVIVHKIAHAAY